MYSFRGDFLLTIVHLSYEPQKTYKERKHAKQFWRKGLIIFQTYLPPLLACRMQSTTKKRTLHLVPKGHLFCHYICSVEQTVFHFCGHVVGITAKITDSWNLEQIILTMYTGKETKSPIVNAGLWVLCTGFLFFRFFWSFMTYVDS